MIQKNSGVYKDLFNRPVTLEYGAGSFIDPDVVIDSPEKIHIGSNTIIRKGVVLRPEGGEIVIGNNCVINHYCVFHGKGGIYIGDWCIIESHSGFYAQNHSFDRFDLPITRQPNSGKGIYLMGDNWIGSHSVLCDDVTLGKGTVIGANSTVTRSIPMATVAVGAPARVIKNRFEENYVFEHRERATHDGMPENIIQYVQGRGKIITSLIDSNDVVLDVGCGEGIITSMIAEKAHNTTGCDYSDSTVKDAKTRYPDINFLQSNVTSLKFEDNLFTKVVFTEVAEHLLPVQLENALDEIARVLRFDGALLITTPLTGAGHKTSNYAHIYEYSLREITALLGIYFNEMSFINPVFGMFLAKNKKITDNS
jgi:acetyltransferase-like isoleucine patch superfamily enzyme/ubiquinone/menaquinone biosynthesis C-methylase UbiE